MFLKIILCGLFALAASLPLIRQGQANRLILTGHVIHADGSAAHGASVFLSVMDEHGVYHWLHTTTDPNGRFAQDVSTLGQNVYRELNVSAVTSGGIARTQTRYAEAASNFVLKLEPTVTISGCILRVDGTPVAGVSLAPQDLTDLKPRLNALKVLPDPDAQKLFGTQTDKAGHFTLRGLPPRTEMQIRYESDLKVSPGSAGSVFITEKPRQNFGTVTLYRPANLTVHVTRETPVKLFRPNLSASEVVLPKFQKSGFFEVTGDFIGERNVRGEMVFSQLFPGEYRVYAGTQVATISLEEGQSLTVRNFAPKPKTAISTVLIPPRKPGEDIYHRNRRLYETPLAFPSPDEVEKTKATLKTYDAALANGDFETVQKLTSPLSFGYNAKKQRFLLNAPLRYREEEIAEKLVLLRFVPRLWLATLVGLPDSGDRDKFQTEGIPTAVAKLGAGADWAVLGGTRNGLSGDGGKRFILAGVLHREAGAWHVVAIPLDFMASQSPEEQLRDRWENKVATFKNADSLTTPAQLPEGSDLAAAKATLGQPDAVPIADLTLWELQLLALMTGEDEKRQLAGDVSYSFPRKDLEAGNLVAFAVHDKTGHRREIAILEKDGNTWRTLARLPIK